MPPLLPESGPSEIVTLNRGVNRMAANLRQLEQDRAVLLAGVSHDLRTPLAVMAGAGTAVRDTASASSSNRGGTTRTVLRLVNRSMTRARAAIEQISAVLRDRHKVAELPRADAIVAAPLVAVMTTV